MTKIRNNRDINQIGFFNNDEKNRNPYAFDITQSRVVSKSCVMCTLGFLHLYSF